MLGRCLVFVLCLAKAAAVPLELMCVVTNLVTASRFSSLSGAFACDSKKACQPGGYAIRAFFLPPCLQKSV
jgi:hypothetical protein